MASANNRDNMLTPPEAAAMLKISVRTLARYRVENIIPAQRYSARLYRFRESDIRDFINRTYKESRDYCE
jgi:excisionase family DNA binding protein